MAKEMKYKTPADFEKVVDAFITECEAGNIPRPTDYRFCIFANISPATLDRYYNGANRDCYNNIQDNNGNIKENIYKGYDVPLKKLIQFREDRLNGLMEDNPKATTAAVFQLKQKHNGGYTDKQTVEASGDVQLNVTLKRPDGSEFNR